MARKTKTVADMSAEWLINGKAMVAEAMAQLAEQGPAADYGKFEHAIQRQAYLLYGEPNGDRRLLRQEAS